MLVKFELTGEFMKNKIKNTIEYKESMISILKAILVTVIVILFSILVIINDFNAYGLSIAIVPIIIIYVLFLFQKIKILNKYFKCDDFKEYECFVTYYEVRPGAGGLKTTTYSYSLFCQFDVDGLSITKNTAYIYRKNKFPYFADYLGKICKILYSESLDLVLILDNNEEK